MSLYPTIQSCNVGPIISHVITKFSCIGRIDSQHAASLETLLGLGAVIESLSLKRRRKCTNEQLNRGRLIDSLRWVYVCISLLAGLMQEIEPLSMSNVQLFAKI